MIHVIATIEAAPGKRGELIAAFRQLVPLVRAEAGCVEYVPALDLNIGIDRQPPERGEIVTVVEKWESEDALRAHLVAPHMQRFREQAKELVASAQIRTLHPAE